MPILPLILVPLATAWLRLDTRLDALFLAAVGILKEIPGATTSIILVGIESHRMWRTSAATVGK